MTKPAPALASDGRSNDDLAKQFIQLMATEVPIPSLFIDDHKQRRSKFLVEYLEDIRDAESPSNLILQFMQHGKTPQRIGKSPVAVIESPMHEISKYWSRLSGVLTSGEKPDRDFYATNLINLKQQLKALHTSIAAQLADDTKVPLGEHRDHIMHMHNQLAVFLTDFDVATAQFINPPPAKVVAKADEPQVDWRAGIDQEKEEAAAGAGKVAGPGGKK